MLAACNQTYRDSEKWVGDMCVRVCVEEVRDKAEGWWERLDDASIASLPPSVTSLLLLLSALAFLPSSLFTFLFSFLHPSLPPYPNILKFAGFHESDGAIGRCHGDSGTLIPILYFTFFPRFPLFLPLTLTFNLSYKTLPTLELSMPSVPPIYWVLWKAWTDVVLTIVLSPLSSIDCFSSWLSPYPSPSRCISI